jgi:hypothetical protein
LLLLLLALLLLKGEEEEEEEDKEGIAEGSIGVRGGEETVDGEEVWVRWMESLEEEPRMTARGEVTAGREGGREEVRRRPRFRSEVIG